MPSARLVAVDLDGTLVRDDGVVDPRDLDALAVARARGVRVVVVTGRLPDGARPLARALAPEEPPTEPHTPMICVDGAVTLCARTLAPLERRPLSVASLEHLADVAAAHELAPLLLGEDRMYGRARDHAYAAWLGGWTGRFQAIDAPTGAGAPILSAFAIGAATDVARARRAAAAAGHEVDEFPLGSDDLAALRLRPAGADKGAALARLCARWGIAADEVVAVGDWYNDIAMLAWAGWSFAMGHAPPDVARAARHRLKATAATGGGVAEALAHAGVIEAA